jgi:hypothetical protein
MRRKCPVCGLYVGAKPHSGALHDRIRAQQHKAKRGLLGRVRRKVRR